MNRLYVQYGAGNEAVKGWISFDSSPTLLIQKTPVLGRILRSLLNCRFDDEIRYGNIVKGLPVRPLSAEGVFCSHVLEHLPLEDFHKALDNTYRILRPGGIFRCIVPDLELYIRKYIEAVSFNTKDADTAAIEFCRTTELGIQKRRKGFVGKLTEMFGSRHFWMWDRYSLSKSLLEHGFDKIHTFTKSNCDDPMFLLPERDHQFVRGVGIECRKPY